MFKTKFKLLSLVLLMIVLISGCDIRQKSKDSQISFNDFTKEIFIMEVQSDTLSLNYSLANPMNYGIEDNPITLGNYSIAQMEKELSNSENYLNRLMEYKYESLTSEQQLTYNILKKYLEQDAIFKDYLYYSESLGPTTGIQAQLPILLAEYNFYSKEDINTYLELLPSVYTYFKDIAAFEQIKSDRGLFMTDKVAARIIEQCKSFINNPDENFLITYFNEKISNYDGLTDKEIASYQNLNRERVLEYIIPSYELLINTLENLKGSGVNEAGLYYYPDGQSYYELLAKSKTGSDKDMNEMAEMLEEAIGDAVLKITQISLSDGELINKLDNFSSFPITDPEEILVDLQKDITKDFPDAIPVGCEIKYVDESLSDYLSPAMYLVPAMDNYTNNNIYINGNDEETLSKIYTTVAHEGYPGHLYQCVYFRSQNPDPIRHILNFTGYDEGWATYVEHYSYSMSGIDNNLAEFLEANSTIILSMYARADIGIHYEGWSKDKAVNYINNFVDQVEVSTEIYETLLEEPAIYLPYAVGFLEIKELREKAEAHLDDNFDAKQFHKFLLEIGPAQFQIIENYMEDWLVKFE